MPFGHVTSRPRDSLTSAIPITEILHTKIHDGDAYSYSYFKGETSGNSVGLLICVGANKQLHMELVASSGVTSQLFILETPTSIGNRGTSVRIRNRRRASPKTTDAVVRYGASFGGVTGVSFGPYYLPADASKKVGVGATISEHDEIIMSTSTSYGIYMTNHNDGVANIHLIWYEE